MLGDIAKSPIVAQRGSRNQFMLGAGVAYTF
jgi:outer membrane scaffolding protein for murein synthesis (MipA/OmpV family)